MANINIKCEKDCINISGEDLNFTRIALQDNCLDMFEKWINSYNKALEDADRKTILLQTGKEIWSWLNDSDWFDDVIQKSQPPIIAEFQIPRADTSFIHQAFIEVPWEIVANSNGHLAKNSEIRFCPVRRVGEKVENEQPQTKYKLGTIFMAASPIDVKPELHYEREESTILNLYYNAKANMDLFVEESGNLELLTKLTADIKEIDAVHISCHGNILTDQDLKISVPILCLETLRGRQEIINPSLLEQAFLSLKKPSLLFLSACKTSETYSKSAKDKILQSFSQETVRKGFPAVLGWSGSVGDYEASVFAEGFYRCLSNGLTLEESAANARSLLIDKNIEITGRGSYESRDWHLARLYLGPKGGGVIVKGKDSRLNKRLDAGVKEFLDKNKKVPVAGRKEFVGRRRYIQKILREFDDKENAGVIIYGIGSQGKSSLASRIASRMHALKTVVIYGDKNELFRYDPNSILNEIKNIADGKTKNEINSVIKNIQQTPLNFEGELTDLLEGHFSGKTEEKSSPILLIIDDLEKILESDSSFDKEKPYKIKKEFKDTIIAIIKAFKHANTKSRLMITSRFSFSAIDRYGDDAFDLLLKIPLSPMTETETEKQYNAKYGFKSENKLDKERVLKACKGNPGLQDMMFGLFNESKTAYLNAIKAMEAYLEQGEIKEEQKVKEFLEDLALDNIIGLINEEEKAFLKGASLFEVPVPVNILDEIYKINQKNKDKNPDYNYIRKLSGLGILEKFQDLVFYDNDIDTDEDKEAFLLNEIIRPKLGRLENEEIKNFSKAALEPLFKTWHGKGVYYCPWVCDKQLLMLGIILENCEVIEKCAENGLRGMHKNFFTKDAVKPAKDSIRILEGKGREIEAGLYSIASDICHQVGEVNFAMQYIEKSLEAEELGEFDKASSYLQLGRMLVNKGEVDKATEIFDKAKEKFTKLEADREMAIVLGYIARIKVDKGEVDEALKLHEEMIQVFERLGDTREKAVTLGDIARIKVDKGEVDEALKLHEERIQVFERLGDTREKAVTLGDIARIKVSKGEVDEALKLHEEMIQVFERLGDTRSKAVTLGDIARIKVSKGEVDEALKLHEERIQVFERLGDTREKAVTLGYIARIKVSKGEVDEALKLQKERFNVNLKLGDKDGQAAALFDIAQIMLKKGEVKKAFECFTESYRIFIQIGRLDGICFVGLDLGELLCQSDQKDQKAQGIEILKRSKEGFEKLGRKDLADFTNDIIKREPVKRYD